MAVIYANAEPAGPPQPSIDQLPAACLAAKDGFRPVTAADLQEAGAGLRVALGRLERWLSADGTKGNRWKSYLHWDRIQSELGSSGPPDLTVLDKTFERLDGEDPGLRLVRFCDARQALRKYLSVARAADNPELATGYGQLLDGLAARLESYIANPTAEDALAIGQAIAWLDAVSQAPDLVLAIRHHLARPNLMVQVSEAVVAAGIAGPVDDTAPIRDVILGTTICGTGHTIGETRVELVADAERAAMDVIFLGTTESDNVGYNGPARIYSHGTTVFDARKRLWIDTEGLRSLPAESHATTRTKIDRIRAKRSSRLVEQIAWQRACKQKTTAEQIASRHAEQRVNRRVNAQGAEMMNRVNRAMAEKFRRPLRQRRLFPERLDFSTTGDFLHVVALQAGPTELAAPTAPPSLTGEPDLSVRLHESLINNLASDALSGMTLREEAFQAAVVEILGELPERLAADEDQEPWGITFARHRPISVTFDDGRFSITLRGQRYYKAGKPHPGMEVTAVYQIARGPQGLKAVRQGELQILPPGFTAGKSRLSPGQIVIQTLLERRFGRIFQEELIGEGLVLPGKWRKMGEMEPVELLCKDGWLAVAWKRVADPQ
ncbi:MAG: hypothetical protein JXB62_06235 [Pirellulales bacterium]|nr:hypothetical protein [Pirellulales bacterium]